jgi:hypothetical protein
LAPHRVMVGPNFFSSLLVLEDALTRRVEG